LRGTFSVPPYRAERQLLGPVPQRMVEVVGVDGELHVAVTALTVLRDICVFADRLATALYSEPHGPFVDDALVTLFPGERHVFRVRRRDGGAIPPDRATALAGGALDVAVRSFGEVASA
jgi:beta-mannosidase